MSSNQLTCPLCQQENRCGINKRNNKACWCESITLVEKTPEITEKLSLMTDAKLNLAELEKSQSCLCQKCLDLLNGLITEL